MRLKGIIRSWTIKITRSEGSYAQEFIYRSPLYVGQRYCVCRVGPRQSWRGWQHAGERAAGTNNYYYYYCVQGVLKTHDELPDWRNPNKLNSFVRNRCLQQYWAIIQSIKCFLNRTYYSGKKVIRKKKKQTNNDPEIENMVVIKVIFSKQHLIRNNKM